MTVQKLTLKEYFKQRVKNIPFMIAMGLFVAILLGMSIHFIVVRQWRNMALSLVFLLFVPAIFILEFSAKMRFVTAFLVLFFSLCIGNVMGAGMDFYTRVPVFDDLLHTLSGVIVTLLGVGIVNRVNNDVRSSKNCCMALFVGVFFSLGVAMLWEMIEYAGTAWFKGDMQEDMIVHEIRSYLLSNTHAYGVYLDNIQKTVIYYGDGQQYVIDGYLDLGLFDTLNDMLVCLIGTVVTVVILVVNKLCHGKLDKWLVPAVAPQACKVNQNTPDFECEVELDTQQEE